MNSPAFRVLATAMLILLVIDYLANLAFTLVRCFTGDLLVKPQTDDGDDDGSGGAGAEKEE